ncbi:MAG: exodeoxyribonuclease VII large subunit [Chloroflexi bacterium]|nr:exodeoxyribonuclease VII large subunit [Chloroflexota bacterium]
MDPAPPTPPPPVTPAPPPATSTPVTTAPAPPGTFGLRILTVGEVSRAISATVRADERLRDLWVEGEVGRVTISSAGHAYFALKDDRAQLQCVWFRDDRVRSAFQPQTGLRIVVHGRIDVYEPQGALQLYVESIQPSGMGDLAIRFEQLKARLAAEGLFDVARKRPLPPRPRVVAVVSSPTGAVWKDVCHVFARRWPLVRVLLVACQVQGEAAPESIVGALRRVERHAAALVAADRPEEAPVVTILARGGGSMEDLWAFNDERVVRAIVAHALPLVSGIGHEIDVTLSDFAADVRAATPSAAAELVVPDRAEYGAALARGAERMRLAGGRVVTEAGRVLEAERRILDRSNPAARLAGSRQQASDLLDRATRALRARLATVATMEDRLAAALPAQAGRAIADRKAAVGAAAAALAVLGPQATLERGYGIVRRSVDGAIVREPGEAPAGTGLSIRVARGELPATAGER